MKYEKLASENYENVLNDLSKTFKMSSTNLQAVPIIQVLISAPIANIWLIIQENWSGGKQKWSTKGHLSLKAWTSSWD